MESNTPPRAFNRAPDAPPPSRYNGRTPSDPDTSRQTQLQLPVPSGPPVRTSVRLTPKGGASHGWQPGRGGGRHNSPLYGQQRKCPSSIDSNVSWSGSKIDPMGAFGAVHGDQEHVSRLGWASSVRDNVPATEQKDVTATAASLYGSSTAQQPRTVAAEREQMGGSQNGSGVQSRNTVQDSNVMVDDYGERSAAQRSRVEVPGQQVISRAGSRTMNPEHVHVTPPPPSPSSSSSVYDEEKNGPQSCPSTFVSTRAPHFSIEKLRQLRGTELVASTLLPTRTSVDSLMGYVRELQLSEASLRKQLVKTKQHTEKELSMSLSKVGELERNMQEVERDRELARQKLQEQERLIRDLADKLKQAETAKAALSNVDELSSIAEEASLPSENEVAAMTALQKQVDTAVVTASTPAASMQHLMQQERSLSTPVHLDQTNENNRSAQHELASPPRSPERSLWDPWMSEGVTYVKNHPPVFTIGSTQLDPVVLSSPAVAQSLTTNLEAAVGGQYELKSVLQSLHQEQERIGAVQNDFSSQRIEKGAIAVPLGVQQEHAQQYIPAMSNVTSMPSLMYSSSSQHDFVSTGAQNAAYHVQSEHEIHADFSPQAIPVTSTDAMYSSNGESWEQRGDVNVSADGYTTNTSDSEVGTRQGQLEGRLSTSLVPPPKSAGGEISDDQVLPSSVHPTEIPTVMSLSQLPVEQPQSPMDPSTGTSVGAKVIGQEQGSNIGADNAFSTSSIPPSSVSPRPSFPTHESEAHCTTSSIQDDSSAAPIEPVSLETLLVDFFTEVDNKRLKMAKVYGKRYAGREKWLFAELTKRYGAAKVAALKARFDTESGGDIFAEANRAGGPEAQYVTKLFDAPNHAEQSRRGSLQRPHVFHPPASASNAEFDNGADATSVSSSVTGLQVRGESHPQSLQFAAEVGTFPILSESVSASPASSQQRHSEEIMPSLFGPRTSFPNLQETDEEHNAASVDGSDVVSLKRGSFPMTQRGEPFSHRSFPPPQTGTESNDASLGLRQRRQMSTSSQDDTVVTLESLLEELYKNHQPDKLKNVATVAKQYAGKERELVMLLKGKYGALSVKRLEECLDVLERAHLARVGSKTTGKRRGCFVRTVSLLFWLSLLLYFLCGFVFISFVVLDVWECHSLDSEEQESEGAEECSLLKEELEAFTCERVADYMGQSHSDACFCSEWKARESALFTNYSGEDIVNLVRMVPFSPESFGALWVATVKAQVPSQEFVDSYVKPVVDLSLDVSSFVWASILELTGSNEASEESLIMGHGDDHGHSDISPIDEDDDSIVHADSYQESRGVDDDDFASNDNADALPRDDEELVEDPTVASTPGVSDDNFSVKNTDALETRPVADELDTSMVDDVLEKHEDVIPVLANEHDIDMVDDVSGKHEDVVPATADGLGTNVVGDVLVEDEDDVPATTDGLDNSAADSTRVESENSIFGDEAFVGEKSSALEMTEDLLTVTEQIDMMEVDDTIPFEVAESIDASEQVSSEETEVGTDVETTWGGSATTATEDYDSAGGADDVPETAIEVLDVAVANAANRAAEEAPKVAAEDAEPTSIEDVVAKAKSVVEVEVRQEGLGLSYPERESGEVLDDESGETSDLPVHENVVPLLGGGEELTTSGEETVFTPPVTNAADKEPAARTSDSTDPDVGMTNVGLDDDAVREVSKLDADTARVEGLENEGSTEVSQVELSPELSPEVSSEFEFVTHVSDPPSISAGVDESVPTLGADESTASSPHGGPEPDVNKNELDNGMDAGAEADATPDDEKVILFEDDGAGTLAYIETEQYPTNPDDVNADEDLSEQSTVHVLDDGSVAIEDDHEELAVPATMRASSLADSDGNVFEENAETGNDDLSIFAEVQEGSEPDLEDDIAVVDEETVVHDSSEDVENRGFGLSEDTEETLAAAAEVDSTADGSILPSTAEVESLEEAIDAMDEVGNDEAESTAYHEIEEEESASEADLEIELDEESVVTEGADMPDDVAAISAEVDEEVDEHAHDDETTGSAADEDRDDPAAETAGHDGAEDAVRFVTETEVTSPPVDAADFGDDDLFFSDEGNVATAVRDSSAGGEGEVAAVEAASLTADSVDATDEVVHADADADAHVHVEDTPTELQPVDDEASAAIEEEADRSLTSTVNEVLAKLVEPFTAAKTAGDPPTTDSEYQVDEL